MSGQDDWDRALEARGQHDAPEMDRRLKDTCGKPERILSSPAVRAITTANLMARVLGVSAAKVLQDERLYLASPKAMLEVIHELGASARHLMLVGHNPGITEFADKLSSERSIDNMPTCGVYSLQFDAEAWPDVYWSTGINVEFDYPNRA